MPFLIYIAVALVAVFGVVVELNVLVEPARHIERGSATAMRSLPPAAPAPAMQVRASQPAQQPQQPQVKKVDVNPPVVLDSAAAAQASSNASSASGAANAADTPAAVDTAQTPPAATTVETPSAENTLDAPPAIAVEVPPAPKCDVAACETAYFTFTPSDCTYQPSNGPRRLCTKGTPPSASADATPAVNASAASAQASAKCNQTACAKAYFTFNPADCTYRPSNGPRRICMK